MTSSVKPVLSKTLIHLVAEKQYEDLVNRYWWYADYVFVFDWIKL